MAATDLARLTRRIDKHDEDIRVVADLLVDVKETVDQHTVQLAAIGERLDAVAGTLQQQGGMLEKQGRTLEQHGGMLAEILRRLEPAS